MAHNADSIGKFLDIGHFGERIVDYGNYVREIKKEFYPFWFGKGNDYWPGYGCN